MINIHTESKSYNILAGWRKFISHPFGVAQNHFTAELAENAENAEKELENLCELLRALPKELGRCAVKALEKIILESS